MAHVPHLYVDGPWPEAVLPLADGQRHHLQRVLRLGEGDPVSYTDGAGRIGEGHLSPHGLVRGSEVSRERPSTLTVAVAPPRARDRVRFVVEKLAELGVARLLWVRTDRTEGRAPPEGKARSWATAALEQSRGAWTMAIGEASLDQLDSTGLVVADPQADDELPACVSSLLIGPEGGFAPAEVSGVPRVSLGPTVLRVETAAVVGAALLRGRPSP